ncbi:hypothetical protein ACXDGR_000156 [Klebsiella pneumoniae]
MITKYSVKYGNHYQLNYNQLHELTSVEVWERGYYATYRKVTYDFLKKEVDEIEWSEYCERNEYELSKFNYSNQLWYRFVETPCHHTQCDLELHEDILDYLNHDENGITPELMYFTIDDKNHYSYESASGKERDSLHYAFLNRPDLISYYNLPTVKKRGFDSGKEAVLYINEIYDGSTLIGYKYGISNGDGKQRLYNQNHNSKFTITKKESWTLDGKVARSIENIIKTKYTNAFTKEEMPDGYTETFSSFAYCEVRALIDMIIDFVK